MPEDGFLSRSNDPKVRWVFATLLVAAAVSIGFAAFSVTGLGPCGPANPWVLGVSSAVSGTAIVASWLVLTSKQRKLRLRTIPFYFSLLITVAFIGFQALLFAVSIGP